ncbi:unnamed protein product [Phytomonas sp. EM1]|nr:unnamed protein product [Phytomonas sp. EM1]|eukprot:CCW61024.1 unnamed protein product [Phytomonas sp. isolate EM1]
MRSFRWLSYASKFPQKVDKFSKAIINGSADSVLQKFTNPHTRSDELVTLSESLLPHITNQVYSVIQQYHILQIFSSRSIRYEPILFKCSWNILKADVPQNAHSSTCDGLSPELTPGGLAFCTAATFSILSRMRLINDQQMLALAFGRCIELSSIMSLGAVAKAYEALGALNRDYFSLTEVYLHSSDMDTASTMKDTLDEVQPLEVSNQPNMVDILCGELEGRLAELSLVRNRLSLVDESFNIDEPPWCSSSDLITTSSAASTFHGSGPYSAAGSRDESASNNDLFSCLVIINALAVVGASSPDIFRNLRSVMESCTNCGGSTLSVGLLVEALKGASHVFQRVIDPLNHEDNPEFLQARSELIHFLVSHLLQKKNLVLTLRRNPQLNLDIRRLFEENPMLVECAFQLWDRIRCIRVAHKHTISQKNIHLPECQLLKGPKTNLKRKTPDLSGAERFVPPQFKTWKSPQHTPRRNRSGSRGAPKVIPFGRWRIPRDYIKKKQRSYSRF